MSSQWGNSRYPPFSQAGPYPPNAPPPVQQQPYIDPRRQYVQPPPVAGFYNHAVQSQPQPQPGYPIGSQVPSYGIPTPSIPVPSILQPGGGGGYRPIQRTSSRADIGGDLFFRPSFPTPEIPGRHSLGPPPPRITHTVSAPPSAPPPVPRKPDFNHPPVPPKPSYPPPLPTAPAALQGSSYPYTAHHAGHGHESAGGGRSSEPPTPHQHYYAEPSSISEEQEYKRVLEQSARDAEARRRQEDEELAQAMQASMRLQSSQSVSHDRHTSMAPSTGFDLPQMMSPTTYSSPVTVLSASVLPDSRPGYFDSPAYEYVPGASTASSAGPGPSALGRMRTDSFRQITEDEALARRLAEEDAREARRKTFEEEVRRAQEDRRALEEQTQAQAMRLQEEQERARRAQDEQHERVRRAQEEEERRMQEEQSRVREEQMRHAQEEQARRIQEEQEQARQMHLRHEQERARRAQEQHRQQTQQPSKLQRMDGPSAVNRSSSQEAGGSALPPQYNDVVTDGPSASMQRQPSVQQFSQLPSTLQNHHPGAEGLYRTTSASAIPSQLDSSNHADVRNGRSHSFGAHVPRPAPSTTAGSPSDLYPPAMSSPALSRVSGGMSLPSVDESHESSAASSHSGVSSQGPVSPAISNDAQSPPIPNSQYVDPDLLAGVSISFGPPVISPQLDPYTDVIPNVIALPYGRSPPLHIKAPNWRNLMRLMALLSETRVEPNIEAQAVVKTAMQLRVVVNFVKVNATSSHWHVVLYLTIDLPIPDDHRYKYRNQSDPSLLPYSYTLAPTPTHLREAADSPLQKWYSIPATNKLPFITLPVYFPDLAQYLIGALEESRRAVADRSSGLGRLAKAVDAFYPGSGQMGPLGAGDDDQDPDNRGIRNRIGKFFGRGQSAQAARPLNDERSTLVTPFYADNYGR